MKNDPPTHSKKSSRLHKSRKGRKLYSNRTSSAWLVISITVLLIVSLSFIFLNYWLTIVVITSLGFGIGLTVFVLRHRRTFSHRDDITPFKIEEQIIEDDHGRVIHRSPPINLSAAVKQGYQETCVKYRQIRAGNSALSQWQIADQIGVSHSYLSEALQAWRMELLDDRPWHKRVWDRINGRAKSDEHRYLQT